MNRITFLVHRAKEYTVRKYLASPWGRPLRSRIRVRYYPGLRGTGRTPWRRLDEVFHSWWFGTLDGPEGSPGTGQIYVFTDMDRLRPREMQSAVELHRRLLEHPHTLRILNHPTRSIDRFELLRTLRDRGINRFSVYRADKPVRPQSWPVIVREEGDHGRLSPLIETPEELERRLAAGRGGRERKVVIEFCPSADEQGIYRKYGAFVLGEKILARQIHFSRQWLVRFPDIRDPETVREELEYVRTNPHREQLREIFSLANVDYGRVDYSVVDGRIQVWEINTNPMILIPKDRKDRVRFPAHDAFGRRWKSALETMLASPAGLTN